MINKKRLGFVKVMGYISLILLITIIITWVLIIILTPKLPEGVDISKIEVEVDNLDNNPDFNFIMFYDVNSGKIVDIIQEESNMDITELNQQDFGKRSYYALKEKGTSFILLNPDETGVYQQRMTVKEARVSELEFLSYNLKYSGNEDKLPVLSSVKVISLFGSVAFFGGLIIFPIFIISLIIKLVRKRAK